MPGGRESDRVSSTRQKLAECRGAQHGWQQRYSPPWAHLVGAWGISVHRLGVALARLSVHHRDSPVSSRCPRLVMRGAATSRSLTHRRAQDSTTSPDAATEYVPLSMMISRATRPSSAESRAVPSGLRSTHSANPSVTKLNDLASSTARLGTLPGTLGTQDAARDRTKRMTLSRAISQLSRRREGVQLVSDRAPRNRGSSVRSLQTARRR